MGAEASVVGLAYVERLVSAGGLPLNAKSWRRAVATAWLLAHKMWDDECLENPGFAASFDYSVDDVNALEHAFTTALGYALSLSCSEYAKYYFALRSIVQTNTETFPLRPLDDDLAKKLDRRAAALAVGKKRLDARGWDAWLAAGGDLSRSF